MNWVIIKGVRYPSSVISAFAAYNMDNPFVKIRIRNKYHIVSFDDVNKMASQMVYLMNNYPDFVQIGRWWISKKHVMSWTPKGEAVDGSGWVISFTLSFGLDNGTQIKFDKEAEDAEIISVRLSPDETPIAYENRVRCLMLSGLSREEAEKIALEPMDLELYYEIGAGLMAVDPAAVESGTIWSPYTRGLYHENHDT